jgi:enoyl-CoA hydratase
MNYSNILYEEAEGIAKIIINRPKVMNALNLETFQELASAFSMVKERDAIRVVIMTGSGEKAFIAGFDINEIKSIFEKGPMAAREEFSVAAQRFVSSIEELGKPVIAAVNGYALGAGSEIAQACHLVIASENARFGQPEINLGFNPCAGGTVRLPRQVGRKKALEMILTGEMIDAQEAHRIGLVNSVVTLPELMQTAEALAKKIIEKSGVAVRLCMDSVMQGLEMSKTEALINEANILGLAATTDDTMEGVKAFLEKRKPVFQNK